MRRLVIGDIHGNYKAMLDVLDRANFDLNKDMLIGIGDYVDGYPDSKSVIEYLRNLPNFKGVIGNHDCFSDDTEALTNNGWKNYKDITLEDKILSLNTETKMLCWDKINEIIVKDIDGYLYNFSNSHIDMLITENHRILHQKRKGQTWGEHKYDIIKNLKGRIKIPTSGFCPKKGINLSDAEIRFIAWILTDGGIAKTKNKNYYTIYQSKENTKKIIRELLNQLGYSFIEKVKDRNITEICEKKLIKPPLPSSEFRISSENSQNIKKFFPEKYPFPNFLFDMSKKQFTIFINEIILGDGTYYNRQKDNKTAILYGTKEFLNSIQTLCIQNEKRAILATDTRGTFRLNISDYTSTSFDIEDKVKEVPYKGTVWCLSVPQTNFVVRRNGKPFISGNCWCKNWLIDIKRKPGIWFSQGGEATLKSYGYTPVEEHKDFLSSLPKYLEIDNMLFVHGGYNPISIYNIEEQAEDPHIFNIEDDLTWDRDLFARMFSPYYNQESFPQAYKQYIDAITYDKVFIGHTTTEQINKELKPLFSEKVIAIDTGGGWSGKITVMDIDTLQYWQSKLSKNYYPNSGR